jgi:hypothetical protein
MERLTAGRVGAEYVMGMTFDTDASGIPGGSL